MRSGSPAIPAPAPADGKRHRRRHPGKQEKCGQETELPRDQPGEGGKEREPRVGRGVEEPGHRALLDLRLCKERKYRDDDHARKAADDREGVGCNVTCQNCPRHEYRGDLDGWDRPEGDAGRDEHGNDGRDIDRRKLEGEQ